MEPQIRFRGVYGRPPGEMGLRFAVDQAPVKASDLFLTEISPMRAELRVEAASHPLGAKQRVSCFAPMSDPLFQTQKLVVGMKRHDIEKFEGGGVGPSCVP